MARVVERLAVTDCPPGAGRRVHGHRAHRPADGPRHPALEGHHDAPMVDVALIAVEELVGALADLHDDRPGLARESADEVLRHRRPVRQRLVLVVDELGHELAHRLLVDEDLVVVGAEVARDHARVLELVVARVPTWSRRVRPHRGVGELGHQRDVGRGVQAARQEDAERDVGHHALADRLAEPVAHLGDHLGLAHPGHRLRAGGRRHRVPPRAPLRSRPSAVTVIDSPAPSFEMPWNIVRGGGVKPNVR